ncbi:hypothetical protein BJX70DRAFT_194296 [Aspergillus crustosus]
MRISSMLSGLVLAGAAIAQNTSWSPQSSDVAVVKYAWALQSLLEGYYTSQPLNQTFLSDATNASRTEYYQNIQGIQRQNRLGVGAVKQVGTKVPGYSEPSCNISHPNATDGESYVRNALLLESSVASALIGATGYTQAPEVSFLLARLAAGHTASATWLAANQAGIVFPRNSTSLVPAYNPEYVLGTRNQTGRLGQYLHGCVEAPSNPSGQIFFIGPLVGSIGNESSATVGATSSPSISPTAAARRFHGV